MIADEGKPIGRILNGDTRTVRAEFTEIVAEGMLVSFSRKDKKFIGRIDRLETNRFSGLVGYIVFLDELDRPPASMTELYIAEEETQKGILQLGTDSRGLKIGVNINPLWGHVLIAGITRIGKTHTLTVLLEELLKQPVPILVIDPHGEMVNLGEGKPDKVKVVEDLRIEDLLSMLRRNMIVVYNLLGYSKRGKVARISELLTDLFFQKEADYQQAQGDSNLLTIPPMLIVVDEADIFAPSPKKAEADAPKGAIMSMVDIATKGGKFGIGMIMATQRVYRLHIDARSQCNSAIIMRLTDGGSKSAVYDLDYIPGKEVEKLSSYAKGQALLTGWIVSRPRKVNIRDIVTRRAKNNDFEAMLGINSTPEKQEHKPVLKLTKAGIVGPDGEVIDSTTERQRRDDKAAFSQKGGDGVVLRDEDEPLDPKIEEEIRKLSEAKPLNKYDDLPFPTHLSKEDRESIKELRKKFIVTQ